MEEGCRRCREKRGCLQVEYSINPTSISKTKQKIRLSRQVLGIGGLLTAYRASKPLSFVSRYNCSFSTIISFVARLMFFWAHAFSFVSTVSDTSE